MHVDKIYFYIGIASQLIPWGMEPPQTLEKAYFGGVGFECEDVGREEVEVDDVGDVLR